MKLIAAVVAAVCLVPALPVRAEENPKPAFTAGAFWKNFKTSLEKSAVAGERKKGRAVAAVRAREQKSALGDPNEPTLKGDARSKKLARQAEEDAELLKAAQLAETDPAAGLSAFEAFQKARPKSHKDEVAQAIAELKKMLEGEKTAAAPAEGKE